jgi:NAD(P)-dependent dehydrogenase (short-subunit alcohol dehydrogenase family)/acyl carrier protein
MPETKPDATQPPAVSTARVPARGTPPAGAEQVIAEFQRSMTHLIESQERVMLAYLGAAPAMEGARPAELATEKMVPAAERLGVAAAAERPHPAVPIAVEPVPLPRSEVGAPVEVGEPTVAGPPDRAAILARLIGIVADRTGYPAELVDAGASLEADLGIDSIKRVEILGELQRSLPAGLERQLQEVMEELSAAPSLGAIADRVAAALAAVARPTAGAGAAGGETGPQPPRAAASRPPDSAEVLARLIAIVVDRTGYPAELVDAGAALEADLGIDSIKRVEILGELQRSLPAGLERRLQEVMEELSAAPSLAEIARRVAAAIADEGAPPAASERPGATPAPAAEVGARGVGCALPRFAMEAVAIAEAPEGTLPAGTILITEDNRGVGAALAASLGRRRVPARLIDCDGLAPDQAYELLDRMLGEVDDLAGVVFLPPMNPVRPFVELTVDEWRQRLRRETGCLFRFAQHVVPALAGRATAGRRPRLLAATTLGGHFALGPCAAGELFPPGHGGICGLMKTLAVEHPELAVKVVDLDGREASDDMAGHLLAELGADDGEVEIGWREGQRWTPRPVAAPAIPEEPLYLDAESVVLLTGGARGITAEIAIELAERFRPTLILVGRSPDPNGESEVTAGISEPRQLKAALIAHRRRKGLSTQLPEVEADYRRVIAEREMRDTFGRLEAAGARWEYRVADVRDPDDMAGLLAEIRSRHGRLDAVLHGAGSIEDKLLLDKHWDSFERVFETKALSTFLLTRELASFFDTLRFVGLFSSVAGTFPNRGQSDYTAANEVVNKIAVALAGGWAPPTCRVVALAWGPWEKGMASDAVQARFRARGVEPIAVSDGRRALLRELAAGPSLPVVVLGRGPWEGVARAGAAPAAGRQLAADDPRPRIG